MKTNKPKNIIKKDEFHCKYCDKEFDTIKGTKYHENMYCKNKENKSKNISNSGIFFCKNCG